MKTNESVFEGMTCRFDGLPFAFRIEDGAPRALLLVETIDGSLHPEEDSTKVFTTSYEPRSRWAEYDWYTDEQLEHALDSGAVLHCDEADCYAEVTYVVFCDHSDTHEHVSDVTYFDGSYYLDSSDLLRTDGNGDTFLEGDDDWVYCAGGDYWPTDECHYCPSSGGWEHSDESDCGECNPPDEEGCVQRYHNHGLCPSVFRGWSGWGVGFEVEKTSVGGASDAGDYVEERDLFAYWETDSSCGIEGITHAYDPLDGALRDRFSRHVTEASDHLGAPADSSCGGHINVSSANHSPRELMVEFRKYAPLWYAVYRHRLNSSYCRNDKKIEHGSDKYSPVVTKPFGIEIRLPSGVLNAEQLQRRFDWIAETCTAIDAGVSFNQYVASCRQLLLNGAYGTDRMKYAKVLRLARKFRVWMLDGIAHRDIQQWV